MKISEKFWTVVFPGVVVAYAIFWVASLYHKPVNVDDAWLGEQAYWLAKVGHVKSNLFAGLNGYENAQLVYHKLFIYQGALMIKLLGFRLYVLKSISIFYLIVFCIIAYYYLKQKNFSVTQFWLFFFLLIANPLIFGLSFEFRPEVMLMTIGFGCFMCLQMGSEKSSYRWVLGGAVLSGLAAFTHLNGVIYIAAGVVLLVIKRQINFALLFGLVGSLVAFLNFVNIHSIAELEIFLQQFHNDPALTSDHFSLFHYLFKPFNEHMRFFHSRKDVAFSLLLLVSLSVGYKSLKSYRDEWSFCGLLILFLSLVSQSYTTKYMVLYLPLLLALIVVSFSSLLQNGVGILLLLAYASVTISYNTDEFSWATNPEQSNSDIAKVAQTRGKKIVAPLEFVFDELEYSTIQSTSVYGLLREQSSLPKSEFDFFDTAQGFNNEIVLLDDKSLEDFAIVLDEHASYGQFRYLGRVKDYFLFRRDYSPSEYSE